MIWRKNLGTQKGKAGKRSCFQGDGLFQHWTRYTLRSRSLWVTRDRDVDKDDKDMNETFGETMRRIQK